MELHRVSICNAFSWAVRKRKLFKRNCNSTQWESIRKASRRALRRTKENLISRQEIIYMDLLLCQLSLIYAENSKPTRATWIPLCGDWCDDYEGIWEDLYLADFCEKAYKLFNVDIPTQIALKIMQYPIPKECLGDGFVVFGGEEPRYSAIAERIGALP